MNIKDYIRFLLPEEIYAVITVMYLISLDKLNKQLLSMKFENPLKLLLYDGSKPIWHFAIALTLFVTGGIVIYCRVKKIYRESLCFGKMIASLASVMVVIAFLILLYIFINNPILRAIFVVVGSGIAVICAFTK